MPFQLVSQSTKITNLPSGSSSDAGTSNAGSSNGRRYKTLCAKHHPWYKFSLCFTCSHRLVAKLILPSSTYMPHDLDLLRPKFPQRFYQFKIPTTDNVMLDGVYITPIYLLSPEKRKTIIYFNGNANFYEFEADIVTINFDSKKLSFSESNIPDFLEKGFAVVLFNYRGVGLSEGYPTRKGLRIDGETIYQYVNKNLQVKDENIILYGHSLGGAIATQVALRHRKVSIISDRSFSSLSKFLIVHFGIFGYFASDLLWQVDWEMDSLKSWKGIQGKKCVVYHPHDPVIPLKAGLKAGLRHYDSHTKFVKLDDANVKKYYQNLYADRFSKKMTDMDREVIELELKEIDAHCRKLMPSELDEILSYFE